MTPETAARIEAIIAARPPEELARIRAANTRAKERQRNRKRGPRSYTEEQRAAKRARDRNRTLLRKQASLAAVPARQCPNCDGSVPPGRPLFCGPRCEQIASLVRYARRRIAEGTYKRPDIAEAIQIKAAILVRGYYDERARRVSAETRQELLARSGGRCEKCGRTFAPGDARFTVQHTKTDNGMVLEAWCYRCNMNHAQSALKPAAGDDLAFLQSLKARIHAPLPLRLCDDPDRWPEISRQLRARW